MDDNQPVDLAEARRKKPQLRNIELRLSNGEIIRYELEWPYGKALRDLDHGELVPRLLAAGFSYNGQPVSRSLLETLPHRTLAVMIRAIDLELAKQDRGQPDALPIDPDGRWFQIEILIAGEWRVLSMRPFGSALRDAADDAVRLREILVESGLTLNGFQLAMWQLAEMQDAEIIAFADAIGKALVENLDRGTLYGN
jgi:hypothetical protein